VDLILDLQNEDLSALNAFDFHFLFIPILQIEGRNPFELEFLRHGSIAVAERSLVASLFMQREAN
jgi:hypothetical protein